MKKTLRFTLTKLGLYFLIRAVWKIISFDRKTWLGFKYLKGKGIEIGALNAPLVVLPQVIIKYLDRMTIPQLRQHYPELATYPLVPVDILDDGEALKTIKPNIQDFIIAHHFLEHCQDPIKTIKNHLRVLKKNGVLYLAVPDHRYNVDSQISATSLNHLIADHQKDLKASLKKHYCNWAYYVDKKRGKDLKDRLNYLAKINYSIHFHQFTDKELKRFFDYLKTTEKLPFLLKEFIFNKKEYLIVLKKI